MKIAHREISPAQPPLVIAEIGINHGGSLDVAKAMVSAAHKAGCEMVKHQTHFVDDEMTDEAKGIFPPNADVSIWEVMARCALSKDDEIALKNARRSAGHDLHLDAVLACRSRFFRTTLAWPASRSARANATTVPLIRHIASFGNAHHHEHRHADRSTACAPR